MRIKSKPLVYLVRNLSFDRGKLDRATKYLRADYHVIDPVIAGLDKSQCLAYITDSKPTVVALENTDGYIGRGCYNQLSHALKMKLPVYVLRKYRRQWRFTSIHNLRVKKSSDWVNFAIINH